jgi:GNAT superfamily N-acetyltransferase
VDDFPADHRLRLALSEFSIRPARPADEAAILGLADRLGAFDPSTRPAAEIAGRERRALAEALARPDPGSALLVAEHPRLGVAGILLLESRRDYFTDQPHGHVAILAVAREAEGQGLGGALLHAAEEWARARGYRRLTLAVFVDNRRAQALYVRQGWRPELEIFYKTLD